MQGNPPMLVIGNPPSKRRAPFHYPKGSPEAKAHMARLRAMREAKRNPLTFMEQAKIVNQAKGNVRLSKKYSEAGLPLHAIHHAGLAQAKAGIAETFAERGSDTFDATLISDEAYDRAGMLMQREQKWGRRGNPRSRRALLAEARRSLALAGADVRAGHRGAAEYWQGRAAGLSQAALANPGDFIPFSPISDADGRRLAGRRRGVPKGFTRDGGRVMAFGPVARIDYMNGQSVWVRLARKTRSALSGPHCASCGIALRPGEGFQGKCPFCVREGNPYGPRARYTHHRQLPPGMFTAGSFRTIRLGRRGAKGVIGRLKGSRKTRLQSILRPKNPGAFRGLPPFIANDPAFRAELAAYKKIHGNGPVRISAIKTPAGFPKFISAYGKAPEIKYDAPSHSNKGRRIHKFGESGGSTPWLVTSVARGPKFLAFVGGTFRAKEWLYR